MIKAQVYGIKTMMDGDVRLTLNVPQEIVPKDIITWSFEDVVVVTREDMNHSNPRDELDESFHPPPGGIPRHGGRP